MEFEQQSPEVKKSLSDVFSAKRKAVSEEVQEGIGYMSNIKRLADAQVYFLSLRQRLLEENHTLIEHFNRYKKKYREQKGDEWEAVSRTSQLRYNSNEKTTIVDGKTSIIKETIDQIESQIQFYQDTIKTVDAALFGTKTRLDIEKMLGV
jgi:hypothetical protein